MSRALSWYSKTDGRRYYDWLLIFNQPHVWVTEDGRVILIDWLDDDHLRNVLAFALAQASESVDLPEGLPLIQALRQELSRR